MSWFDEMRDRADRRAMGVVLLVGSALVAASTAIDVGTTAAAPAGATSGVLVVRLTEPARLSSDARRTGIPDVDRRLSDLSVVRIEPVFDPSADPTGHRDAGLDRIYRVELDPDVDLDRAGEVLRGSGVEEIELELPMRALGVTPNDPHFASQWALENRNVGWVADTDTDCESAWVLTTGSPSVTIAILDTGVDLGHPEFAGRIVAGTDIVNGDALADDDEGHGTACAGIATATGNNSIGVAGVSWQSRLMPVKVLDSAGNGNTTWTAQGIVWAADQGAKILSISLGGPGGSPTLQSAVDYAFNTKGCLLFCATGNDDAPALEFPAAYTNAVGVGALSPCNERKNPTSCDNENWWGSNYGTGLDFLAPGVKIYTTDIRGISGYSSGDYFSSFNGTSAATPHAAGIAALVWAVFPGLSNSAVLNTLRTSCVDMGAIGYDVQTGYGRLNAANAIESRFYGDATSLSLSAIGDAYGVAWGDYDDDGDADAFLSYGSGQDDRLFRNDAGVLDLATAAPLDDPGEGRGVAWADYDNDGDLDLLLANEGEDRLFRNDGGTFTVVASPAVSDPEATHGVAWGDYDRDGDLDFYAVNHGTGNRLVRNDGGDVFTDVSATPLINNGFGQAAAWGDSDNDGDLDLYLTNEGANRLFRNNGDGTFLGVTPTPINDANTAAGASWGDFDNDGRLDLCLANTDAPNRLFRNLGGNSWSDVAPADLAWGTVSAGVAWGDVDNDGDLDLFLTSMTEPSRLLRNEGQQEFSTVRGSIFFDTPASGGRGAAFADFDLDGDVDLLIARSGLASQLVRNDWPSLHHWLTVRLVGVAANRDGIGARVRVKAGGVWRLRHIDGGSGYFSQNEPVAHFGLGNASTVDSLEVRWPDGDVQQLVAIGADQRITVTQGVVTSVDGGALLDFDRLESTGPNPFGVGAGTRETAIAFRLAAAGEVTLRVFGIDGRLVRTLVSGARTAGLHSARWDGTDDSGRGMGAGIYFARFESRSTVASRKILLVR